MKTARYPDTDRSEWHLVSLVAPHFRDGLTQFSYAVYPSKRAREAGDDPFYLNSHKANLRQKYFRMVKEDGRFLHKSGIRVSPVEMDEFLRSSEAYKWEVRSEKRWRSSKGDLTPYFFPTYSGRMEQFDPQWIREEYELSLDGQIAKLLDIQLASVQLRRLDGDHQGTTFDLTVGQSTDDVRLRADDASTAPHTWTELLANGSQNLSGELGDWVYGVGLRWGSLSITKGDNIDVAYFTMEAATTNSSTTTRTDIFAEDADDAATFTDVANANGRALTAGVAWDSIESFVDGTDYNSSSFTVPLKTVVDRAGWNSDGFVVLWEDGDSDDNASRHGVAYDQDIPTSPRIHVEASTPVSSFAGSNQRNMSQGMFR